MFFKWCLLFISFPIWAAPSSLEVWFLSNSKKAQLLELMNRPEHKYFSLTAALECQEMGDYCFDPQYGLYKKDDMNAEVNVEKAVNKKEVSIPAAKSVERDVIECEEGNYFDVFCGKAKKQTSSVAKLDLWIDTSSSMREFDFSDKEGGCFRKSLVKRLDEHCPFNEKVNVMMFDTSIKQAGSEDVVCNNQGLNDYKRLIDWIERSNAKKLVIITDIHEFHKEFADYVEQKHGTFRGDKDALTAEQMLSFVDDLAKSCK
jgi:hypothetical protein